MKELENIDQLIALRDRLRSELIALNDLILAFYEGVDEHRRALARFELGEVWGATKLARHLGVARNTAYRLMRTEFAELTWEDSEGRLRLNAADVERQLADRQRLRAVS